MKKGIVLEMNERFLTLLTPEGEFLKVKKTIGSYEVGEEITIPAHRNIWSEILEFLRNIRFKSIAAVSVACILALFFFIPNHEEDVYAYMSIDINPSIELGVNEDLKVVEMTSYNEKGKEIINGLKDWKMQDMKDVTNTIIESMKSNGYSFSKNEVVIGTVHTGKSIEKSDNQMKKVINELQEDLSKVEAKVISVEATAKEREKAVEAGVTAGKLISQQKNKGKQQETKKKTEKPPIQNNSKDRKELAPKLPIEQKGNERQEKLVKEKEKPQGQIKEGKNDGRSVKEDNVKRHKERENKEIKKNERVQNHQRDKYNPTKERRGDNGKKGHEKHENKRQQSRNNH